MWEHKEEGDFLGGVGFRAELEEVVLGGKPTSYTRHCRLYLERSPAHCPTSGCFRSCWTGISRAEEDPRFPQQCELQEVGTG